MPDSSDSQVLRADNVEIITYASSQGIIVDDKKLQGLPTVFKQVWIDRARAGADYTSLDDVRRDWDRLVT